MSKIKPQLPSGMRDFLPGDMLRRKYVFDTISGVFETYGFEPFQTPVMELRDTLMGKYGDDAERLLYYAQHPGGKEQLALRYDLTVPLARAFALHESEIGSLPFKRYQIAPVWRGERPQRGRFREFYQCDVDIVGIPTMDADAELLSLAVTAFGRLGLQGTVIKVNNRKLLTGIGEYAGLHDAPLADLYRTIDKIDKIGIDGARDELIRLGIEPDVVARIIGLIENGNGPRGANGQDSAVGYDISRERIRAMRILLRGIATAEAGLEELELLLNYCEALGVPDTAIEFDPKVVRGLSYYTGNTFEAMLTTGDDPSERIGSIAGGGRYDDLLGLFRKDSLPTVGISLGVERLIVLLDNRDLYPPGLNRTVVQVLVTVFGPETRHESMALAAALRRDGVNVEVFMQDAKLGKQLTYCDKKGIPLAVVLGPEEIASGKAKLKVLANQSEFAVKQSSLSDEVRRQLIQLSSRAGSTNLTDRQGTL